MGSGTGRRVAGRWGGEQWVEWLELQELPELPESPESPESPERAERAALAPATTFPGGVSRNASGPSSRRGRSISCVGSGCGWSRVT